MFTIDVWTTVGFAGQFVFASRFYVQWLASEKKGESVVPIAFWWLSLLGGAILLAYTIYLRNAVFITGQAAGLFIYTRNLVLIYRKRAQEAPALVLPFAGARERPVARAG